MHQTPIRDHAGSCVTGQQQPWTELRIGFPAMSVVGPAADVLLFEAGGPLDAPAYLPRGGAEVFQAATGPVVFFHETRGGW